MIKRPFNDGANIVSALADDGIEVLLVNRLENYEKYLNVFYYDILGNKTLILKIKFYGEGVGEDERFRIHLENFGIKFNKTDGCA